MRFAGLSLLLTVLIGASSGPASAGFVDIGLVLPPLGYSSVTWADYDSDGDLDLTYCGYDGSGTLAGIQTHIYRNDAGLFTDIAAPVAGLNLGTAVWGDCDNDGDLDLLLYGVTTLPSSRPGLYRNDGGVFTLLDTPFNTNYGGNAAWGDYDGDGRLDLVVTGINGSVLFHNDGDGHFTDAMAGLSATGYGSWAAWGDYDDDGDLDLVMVGGGPSRLYRNDAGAFTDVGAGLPSMNYGSAAWGDFDNDGDLDLALCGQGPTGPTSWVLRNDDAVLTDIGATLPGATNGSIAWGDYDNDGDLDLLLAGDFATRVCRNDGAGQFVDVLAGLAPVQQGGAAWGDFDNDGRLDIALAGGSMESAVAAVYRNDAGLANNPPGPPTGLSASVNGRLVTVSWDAGSDAETPQSGLTYNVRIGSSPGTQDLLSGMAMPAGGWRLLPGIGNSQSRQSWTIALPHDGTWYWSVQAIDGAFAGSAFAPEQAFSGGATPITFTDLALGLPGVGDTYSDFAGAWGDFDNDGDFDLVLSGQAGDEPITRLYRNEGGGQFVDANAGLIGMTHNALVWGDWDSDGDLDLLLSGYSGSGGWSGVYVLVYRNDGSGHFSATTSLPAQMMGAVAAGDYDNDGLMDIALTGITPGDVIASRIYRNTGGGFSDIGASLVGVTSGGLDWGDYDNDGDLDLALMGVGDSGWVTRLYRNDGGTFVDSGAAIDAGSGRSVNWGDYDGDGDLDLAAGGSAFRNDAGAFTRVAGPWPTGGGGTVAWGDYDNDGDLDILYTGYGTHVFRNTGGHFADAFIGLASRWAGSGAWGDCDNDGDLDMLLVGSHDGTWIYRNDGAPSNTLPATPTGLHAEQSGDRLTLSWNGATDAETPAAGLSYNLRVGTTPGSQDLFAGLARPLTGSRLVPRAGNAQARQSWTVRLRTGGGVYWSVQAIDGAFASSPFAPEQTIGGAGFLQAGPALRPASNKDAAWGDYDNDGDLDLLLSGCVHRNDGDGTFPQVACLAPNQDNGAAAWGDYDGDGDLDVLEVTREGHSGLFRNDGSDTFVRTPVDLPDVYMSSADFGDFDNDGDLDFVLSGYSPTVEGYTICRIYRNDHGTFTDIQAGLPGVHFGSTAWGDYDNDGDLDLLVTGWGWGGVGTISRIYRNDDGHFTDANAGLQGMFLGSGAWGDYDADGDLDLLLTGMDNATGRVYAVVYRNDHGAFSDTGAGLPGVNMAVGAWADFDNDGDLDIGLNGSPQVGPAFTRIYRNDDGLFVDIGAGLPATSSGALAWGDYDNDSRVDLLVGTMMGSRVYRNTAAPADMPPSAPTGLSAIVGPGYELTLNWEAALDAETPSEGLSYNLFVRTTPGDETVVPGMSDVSTGYRRVATLGNAQCRTSWTLTLPHPEHYSWRVQAIDGAFAGSAFSDEFVVHNAVRCAVAPSYLDFGTASIRHGDVVDRSFQIRNVSDLPLSGNITEACPDYSIVSGGGPFTLAPEESLSVMVRFRPTAYWTRLCSVDLGCPECGVVHCSGVGDDPTPVVLAMSAEWTGNSVDITWSSPVGSEEETCRLDRYSIEDSRPFEPVTAVAETDRADRHWRDETVRPGCRYRYHLTVFDRGVVSRQAEATILVPIVGWELLGNRPNPFSDRTRIAFSLPDAGRVHLDILDIRGRIVLTIDSPPFGAGEHWIEWDGRDRVGARLPDGLYLCRVSIPGQRPLALKVLMAR